MLHTHNWPLCCPGSPTRNLQRMGTIRNVHGDSVIALDTPDGRMAVELSRSRSVGSTRHAVLNLSTAGSCRSASRRSLSRKSNHTASRRMHSHLDSGSETSDTSLPPVAMQHHSCTSSGGDLEASCASCSGTDTEDSSVPVGSSSSSEAGTVRRPIRALVASFQSSSEQVLLSSFMHLQVSVIVEFAVQMVGLRAALIQNHQVGRLSITQC